MKLILVIIFSLFIVIVSPAQQAKVARTIKGKVINSATSEPVSYTNIGIEGTFYGTSSNGDGDFELKIPEEMVNDNIFFSAVGFANKNFPVKTLFEREVNLVKIEPQSYDIKEVDIAAQSKVLIRILTMASEEIPYNFISGPLNLECSYTNNKTINDTVSVIQNAGVLVYDETGYSNPSKLDAYQHVKYALKKEDWKDDYRFSSGKTNLDEMLGLDWVRSAYSVLNPGILNDFQLKLDSEPVINGKAYWTISFSQKNPTLAGSGDFYASEFSGKITIEKEDYAVLKIEGSVKSPVNNRQGKSLAIGKSTAAHPENVSYNFSINFINLKPEIITLNKKYTLKGEKIQENSTLTVDRVKTTQVTALDSRQYFTGE